MSLFARFGRSDFGPTVKVDRQTDPSSLPVHAGMTLELQKGADLNSLAPEVVKALVASRFEKAHWPRSVAFSVMTKVLGRLPIADAPAHSRAPKKKDKAAKAEKAESSRLEKLAGKLMEALEKVESNSTIPKENLESHVEAFANQVVEELRKTEPNATLRHVDQIVEVAVNALAAREDRNLNPAIALRVPRGSDPNEIQRAFGRAAGDLYGLRVGPTEFTVQAYQEAINVFGSENKAGWRMTELVVSLSHRFADPSKAQERKYEQLLSPWKDEGGLGGVFF